MNKNKTILLSIAGVIALASAVMAYLDWSAYSAKTAALEGDDMEGIEGLESVIVKAEKLSRKEIYPSAESVKAIEEKIARLEEWQKEAKRLASRGDKVFAKTTPAAFKEFIVTDAKRLSQLPGDVGGALVKSEFTFGPFKEYIAEGKMPAESELAPEDKWIISAFNKLAKTVNENIENYEIGVALGEIYSFTWDTL